MIVVCSWQELEARWLAGNISVLVASLAAETHCQFTAWPERVSEMVASLSVETDSVQVSEGRGLGNWLSTITIAGSRNTRDSSRMRQALECNRLSNTTGSRMRNSSRMYN